MPPQLIRAGWFVVRYSLAIAVACLIIFAVAIVAGLDITMQLSEMRGAQATHTAQYGALEMRLVIAQTLWNWTGPLGAFSFVIWLMRHPDATKQ